MGQVSQEDQAKWAYRVAHGKKIMYDNPKDAKAAAKTKITSESTKPAGKPKTKARKRISTKK